MCGDSILFFFLNDVFLTANIAIALEQNEIVLHRLVFECAAILYSVLKMTFFLLQILQLL